MKQEQQRDYTTNEAAYQVVMPLNLGIKIPEEDSVRLLMRIAERIDFSKLSGAYERECRSEEATPKQMFLLVVLAFMNGIYSTRKIEKACRCDIVQQPRLIFGRFLMIRLQPVTPEQRQLLFNLNQKYLYEMTNFYDDPLDAWGNLHYGHFDEYFTDPARTALLIYDDDALAGFAMLNPYSTFGGRTDYVMAEFTIFPMYRHRHLATRAAEAIFARCPGRWEVKFNEKNVAGRVLWTRVTARYAPIVRHLNDVETVLCFTVG